MEEREKKTAHENPIDHVADGENTTHVENSELSIQNPTTVEQAPVSNSSEVPEGQNSNLNSTEFKTQSSEVETDPPKLAPSEPESPTCTINTSHVPTSEIPSDQTSNPSLTAPLKSGCCDANLMSDEPVDEKNEVRSNETKCDSNPMDDTRVECHLSPSSITHAKESIVQDTEEGIAKISLTSPTTPVNLNPDIQGFGESSNGELHTEKVFNDSNVAEVPNSPLPFSNVEKEPSPSSHPVVNPPDPNISNLEVNTDDDGTIKDAIDQKSMSHASSPMKKIDIPTDTTQSWNMSSEKKNDEQITDEHTNDEQMNEAGVNVVNDGEAKEEADRIPPVDNLSASEAPNEFIHVIDSFNDEEEEEEDVDILEVDEEEEKKVKKEMGVGEMFITDDELMKASEEMQKYEGYDAEKGRYFHHPMGVVHNEGSVDLSYLNAYELGEENGGVNGDVSLENKSDDIFPIKPMEFDVTGTDIHLSESKDLNQGNLVQNSVIQNQADSNLEETEGTLEEKTDHPFFVNEDEDIDDTIHPHEHPSIAVDENATINELKNIQTMMYDYMDNNENDDVNEDDEVDIMNEDDNEDASPKHPTSHGVDYELSDKMNDDLDQNMDVNEGEREVNTPGEYNHDDNEKVFFDKEDYMDSYGKEKSESIHNLNHHSKVDFEVNEKEGANSKEVEENHVESPSNQYNVMDDLDFPHIKLRTTQRRTKLRSARSKQRKFFSQPTSNDDMEKSGPLTPGSPDIQKEDQRHNQTSESLHSNNDYLNFDNVTPALSVKLRRAKMMSTQSNVSPPDSPYFRFSRKKTGYTNDGEDATTKNSKNLDSERYANKKFETIDFCINSVTIPEIKFSLPKTTSLATLKKTAMDAILQILQNGIRIRPLFRGQKKFDSNISISQILEENHSQSQGQSHLPQSDALSLVVEPGMKNMDEEDDEDHEFPILVFSHSSVPPKSNEKMASGTETLRPRGRGRGRGRPSSMEKDKTEKSNNPNVIGSMPSVRYVNLSRSRSNPSSEPPSRWQSEEIERGSPRSPEALPRSSSLMQQSLSSHTPRLAATQALQLIKKQAEENDLRTRGKSKALSEDLERHEKEVEKGDEEVDRDVEGEGEEEYDENEDKSENESEFEEGYDAGYEEDRKEKDASSRGKRKGVYGKVGRPSKLARLRRNQDADANRKALVLHPLHANSASNALTTKTRINMTRHRGRSKDRTLMLLEGRRRIRRPFSVSEVSALVEAVERVGLGKCQAPLTSSWWREIKADAFANSKHRTYVDLKDKWKTLVHTAKIAPSQRRGEPVPQDLLDRVTQVHNLWTSNVKSKRIDD